MNLPLNQYAEEARLAPEQLERLRQVVPSDDLKQIMKLMVAHARANPASPSAWELIARFSDDYPYDLGEWLKSLCELNHWLCEQQRTSDLWKMLGYLTCCAEFESHGISRQLEDVVMEMLTTHGYTG